MIRHALDPARLRADIEREDANWFTKAAERTQALIELGYFDESSSIWSKAKPAFMLLQSNKCAFCERPFTGPNESRIEMDLEHFRPKSAVAVWEGAQRARSYPQETGAASKNGYYWLANDISNYLAACKICNSDYKRTYFPISGTRCESPRGRVRTLAAEKSYLIYPVGNTDEDPENIITFTGTVARPVAPNGHNHARAAIIIDFFGLNERDQLHIQRAETIERFGNALVAVADGRAMASDQTYVANISNPLIPHAACLRAFKRLWDQDQAAARRILGACSTMLANRLLNPNAAGLGVGYT
jgi:hypothetical protein